MIFIWALPGTSGRNSISFTSQAAATYVLRPIDKRLSGAKHFPLFLRSSGIISLNSGFAENLCFSNVISSFETFFNIDVKNSLKLTRPLGPELGRVGQMQFPSLSPQMDSKTPLGPDQVSPSENK